MTSMLTRRSLLAAGAAICLAGAARAQRPAAVAPDPAVARAREALARLEAGHHGRLGVAAVDTGSGRRLAHRADERFAMCSTHKLLTAAAVLAQADRGAMSLDRKVAFGGADLQAYAPVTKRLVGDGFMTVEALCAAAVAWSDNTAANLLLGLIGGPAGWTRYVRSLGDKVSRLDRTEPTMNTAVPGDPRDTTTPAAMLGDLDAVLLGRALSATARARLESWMADSPVTGNLLRAGLPAGWRVGDKSGSGENGTRNDIGVIRPAGAAPILAAVYYTGSAEPPAARDRVVAEAGRIVAAAFRP